MSELLKELKTQGVDTEKVLKRFVGREDLYIKFLNRFLEDDSYQKLEKRLQENNVEEAFKAAHTLKGVATNLGLEDIMKSVIPIAETLRAGALDEGKTIMEQLKTEYEKTVTLINIHN